MGTSAQVRDEERERLRIKGFSDPEIERIDSDARRHAKREDQRDWFVGPERKVLTHHLDVSGIAPTDTNVRRLRAGALCVSGELIELTGDRYITVPLHLAAIASEALRDPSPARGPRPAPQPREPALSPDVPAREVTVQATAAEAQPKTFPTFDLRSAPSLMTLVQELVRARTNPKAKSWDIKTARQHLSIAKLFCKVAGTDDPLLLTQSHVGAYISLPATLPTHWGKSSTDEERTIDEMMARVEDLDDDFIGLAAPTINRHRSQLSIILAHAEENGFLIGAVSKRV